MRFYILNDLLVLSLSLADWTVRLHLNGRIESDQFDQVNCSTVRYENRLDNLSILYSSRAYFCAAFSVIYKEISELNKLAKVTTSCFVLPEQRLEFEEVAIALGKNVDWLVKKSTKSQGERDDALQERSLANNQQTNRLIGEKVWNLVPSGRRRDSKANKKLNKMNKANLLSQFGGYFDNRLSRHTNNENNHISALRAQYEPVNGTGPRIGHLYDAEQNSLDNLIVGQSNREASGSHKRAKANTFSDFNAESMQFAIEIIDSLSGKVFRSNHHSNDILQSINFQNFELQKMNNSLVYVQKRAEIIGEVPKPEKVNQTNKKTKSKQNNRQSKQSKFNKQTHLQSNQTDQPFLLRLFTRTGKQFLDQFEQIKSLQKPTVATRIVEKKIDNLFRINNESISIRQYVLVKNLNPLRAYLFNEGLVFFMQNTTQYRPRTGHWLFSQLRDYLDRWQPTNNVYLNLLEVLQQFLLISEFHLISDFKFLERFHFFNQRQYDPSDSQFYQFNQYEQPEDRFRASRRLDQQQQQQQQCNLRQYQLMEIELVVTEKLEFYIVDVNLEPLMFDNQQAPYRDYGKQAKKELYAFQKNLLTSVWRLVGVMEPKKSSAKSGLKNSGKNSRSPGKRHSRRSISLKKIKDLPRKYLDQLSKQSSKVRRKLLFVNSELNYKHKLINNWQANQFRRVLSRLLVEQNVGIMGLNCLVSHKLCLTETDLRNILLSNAELTRNGNTRFEQLYPSSQMCTMNGLVEQLNGKLLSTYADLRQNLHRTADLHSFLCKLETQLSREGKEGIKNDSADSAGARADGEPGDDGARESAANDYGQDERMNADSTREQPGDPVEPNAFKSDYSIEKLPEELLSKNDVLAPEPAGQQSKTDYLRPPKDYSYSTNDFPTITDDLETIENVNPVEKTDGKYREHSNSSLTEDDVEELNRNCSSKEEDLYMIDKLELQPKIDLRIQSKSQTQFKIQVDYGLIKMSVFIKSKHCNGRVKFNQLNSPSINVSLNLGIGPNKIVFRVVNDLNRPNDQSRTYQLIIQRLSLEQISVYDRLSREQVICQINQVSVNDLSIQFHSLNIICHWIRMLISSLS